MELSGDHLRERARMLDDLASQISVPNEAARLERQAKRYREEADRMDAEAEKVAG